MILITLQLSAIFKYVTTLQIKDVSAMLYYTFFHFIFVRQQTNKKRTKIKRKGNV